MFPPIWIILFVHLKKIHFTAPNDAIFSSLLLPPPCTVNVESYQSLINSDILGIYLCLCRKFCVEFPKKNTEIHSSYCNHEVQLDCSHRLFRLWLQSQQNNKAFQTSLRVYFLIALNTAITNLVLQRPYLDTSLQDLLSK